MSAFKFYEKLNLKTFFTLLQILLPELAREEEADGDGDLGRKLSAISRRILPSLRNYSSWLVSNASDLVAQSNDASLGVHIKEFWSIYANTLTLLAATFPAADLPAINYLVEEDEDVLSFLPLINDSTLPRFCGSNEQCKPRHGPSAPKELPSVEMLSRIRQLLADGIGLVFREDEPIPIDFIHEETRFIFQEEGLPKELHSPPHVTSSHAHSRSATSINRDDIERARASNHVSQNRVDDERSTAAASTSNATTMNNMVNELVDSDATDLSSSRPQAGFQKTNQIRHLSSSSITAQDLVKSMQRPVAATAEREETFRSLASSIWTPMPGETGASPQIRPGTAHRTFEAAGSVTPQLPPAPTSSFFQEDLARQHQQVQMRSSNLNTPATPSSWASHQENTPFNQYRPGSQGSPWGVPTTSAVPFSSPFSVGNLPDIPRRQPAKAQFGAIGQTPPSGQGG